VYAAILRIGFPVGMRDEVVRFLRTEMLPVIQDNAGFADFRVLDADQPGELVMIDTWRRREDSVAAASHPDAVAVHARYAELGITVLAATRHHVLVSS